MPKICKLSLGVACLMGACQTTPLPQPPVVTAAAQQSNFEFANINGHWSIVEFTYDDILVKRDSPTSEQIGQVRFRDDLEFGGISMSQQATYSLSCYGDERYFDLTYSQLKSRTKPDIPGYGDVGYYGPIGCGEDAEAQIAALGVLFDNSPELRRWTDDRIDLVTANGKLRLERLSVREAARAPTTLKAVAGTWTISDVNVVKPDYGRYGWGAEFALVDKTFLISASQMSFSACADTVFKLGPYKAGRVQSQKQSEIDCAEFTDRFTGTTARESHVDDMVKILSGEVRFELMPEIAARKSPDISKVLYLYDDDSFIALVRP